MINPVTSDNMKPIKFILADGDILINLSLVGQIQRKNNIIEFCVYCGTYYFTHTLTIENEKIAKKHFNSLIDDLT